jgi:hypothetical protein
VRLKSDPYCRVRVKGAITVLCNEDNVIIGIHQIRLAVNDEFQFG